LKQTWEEIQKVILFKGGLNESTRHWR